MRGLVFVLALTLAAGGAYLTYEAWPSGDRGAAPSEQQGVPEGPVVGYRAPDFAARTLAGDSLRLSELRGTPLVINFWATWCPPCRAEMPAIEKVHEAYGGRVRFVGVDMQESAAMVRAFVADHGFTWTFVLDPAGEVAQRYRVRTIPTSFFVDRRGIVRAVHYGEMSEQRIRDGVEDLLAREGAP